LVWTLKFGNEAANIETMKASHQRIPEHLKNQVKPPESLFYIWFLFWEFNLERDHFGSGLSKRIKPSVIEERLKAKGIKSNLFEEFKEIIMEMDREYVAHDKRQFRKLSKGNK